MQVRMPPTIHDYLKAADVNTKDFAQQEPEFVSCLEKFYTYFAFDLWDDTQIRPLPGIMSLNAFTLWLAGTRVALSGHPAATFPVMRSALESACYAFMMTNRVSMERIWLNRHKDEQSLKNCRKSFGSVVRDTAREINKIQPESADWIVEAYEEAINFGAHPNVRSVINHVEIVKDEENGYANFDLTGLYSHSSFEARKTMVACLDYGLALAIVLTRTIEDADGRHERGLNELNNIKNAIVEALVATGSVGKSRRG